MLPAGLHNIDAMVALREYPDNYFDLAIADPPYGHGFANNGGCQGWFSKYHQNAESPDNLGGVEPIRGTIRQIQAERGADSGIREADSRNTRHYTFGLRKKDKNYEKRRAIADELRKKIITWDVAPGQDFFEELFRVSRNQIIWGG